MSSTYIVRQVALGTCLVRSCGAMNFNTLPVWSTRGQSSTICPQRCPEMVQDQRAGAYLGHLIVNKGLRSPQMIFWPLPSLQVKLVAVYIFFKR